MTPKEAINAIEEILNSTINNDESLDYELTSFDLYWLKTAKEALTAQAQIKAPVFSMQQVKNSDKKIYVTDCQFKAIFAYWLYNFCPKHPRKFETIMSKLMKVIDETFNEGTSSMRMISVAYKDVHNWIKSIVESIPEIMELNLTTNEFNAGVTLETRENPNTIVLTSRYSTIPEGEDFVDVGALVQQVTYSICKEAFELQMS